MRSLKKPFKDILVSLRDFPNSLYVNFRSLPWNQARMMPIQVKWDTKIRNISKGSIEIDSEFISKKMIRIGYQGGGFIHSEKTYIDIINGGKVVFKGTATIADGASLFVDGGVLSVGNYFYSNRNLQIHCEKKISFGNDVLLGWNVRVRDNDGHHIYVNNVEKPTIGEIKIGNHVWIASEVTILKNSVICDDSLIACNSIVCGLNMTNNNCLVAGIPAKIKKENISWKE